MSHPELAQRVLLPGDVLGLAVPQTRLLEEVDSGERISEPRFEHPEVAEGAAFDQGIAEHSRRAHTFLEPLARAGELSEVGIDEAQIVGRLGEGLRIVDRP